MFKKLQEKYNKPKPLTLEQFRQFEIKLQKTPLVQSEFKSPVACQLCHSDNPYDAHICLPNCGHIYHRSCIQGWLLEKSNKCPYCSTKVMRRLMAEERHPDLKPPVVDGKQKSTTNWDFMGVNGGGGIDSIHGGFGSQM